MNISIKNVPQDILVHTVSLIKNKENPSNVYLFRCTNCGTAISQIQGEVKSIYAEHIPTDNVAVFNKCYKCGRNYIFNTLPYAKIKSTQIILCSEKNEVSIFHCWICRMQLIEYSDDFYHFLPDGKIHATKFGVIESHFHCFMPTCKHEYCLEDIVTIS